MAIEFERGDRERPKGHAILYFQSSSDPNEVWATYLIILPISVDVAKYVPPFLMNQVGELGANDLSAFAFPPAPERVDGRDYLEELAATREDDILFGGSINPADVPSAMMSVNEAVQHYAEVHSSTWEAYEPSAEAGEESAGLGVNEVLYELMSDSDKLGELTKLVGRLRFAVEGGEDALTKEAEADIALLAKHVPDEFQIARLIAAAKAAGPVAARLADLCLQRCFHLAREEFVKLGQVEKEIETLEASAETSA